jgi:hypothetical protein
MKNRVPDRMPVRTDSLTHVITNPWTLNRLKDCLLEISSGNRDVEHCWLWTGKGECLKSQGDCDSVTPPSVAEEDDVVLDVHNHPNPSDQRHAFMHSHDIGSSFSTGDRIFSTNVVVIQAPLNEYWVACRFKDENIRQFLGRDFTPHKRLFRILEKLHGDSKQGARFQNAVLRCQSIFEMHSLFSQRFDMLEFVVFRLNDRGDKVNFIIR